MNKAAISLGNAFEYGNGKINVDYALNGGLNIMLKGALKYSAPFNIFNTNIIMLI